LNPPFSGSPTRANWFGVALKAKPRYLAGLSNFFYFIWVNFQKSFLSLQKEEEENRKKRKATSGLQADRIRNINKI